MCIINASLWKLPMTLITSGCAHNICVDLNAWWSFSVFWDSKQKFVNNARLKTKNNKETVTRPVSSREKKHRIQSKVTKTGPDFPEKKPIAWRSVWSLLRKHLQMRNSKLFNWQLRKQQIVCLLSHQNRERQHWTSPLWCLSEPWPWDCTSTAAKGPVGCRYLLSGAQRGPLLVWFGYKQLPVCCTHHVPSPWHCVCKLGHACPTYTSSVYFVLTNSAQQCWSLQRMCVHTSFEE